VRLTLIDQSEIDVDATIDANRVLVGAADLANATGWELKPEGLCRGPVCVPVTEDVAFAGSVDLRVVARVLRRALVVSEEGAVAALAGDPMSSGSAASCDELELPDLDGTVVRMSDFAGRKRLLVAWASW
jgi:hypothetical protein